MFDKVNNNAITKKMILMNKNTYKCGKMIYIKKKTNIYCNNNNLNDFSAI